MAKKAAKKPAAKKAAKKPAAKKTAAKKTTTPKARPTAQVRFDGRKGKNPKTSQVQTQSVTRARGRGKRETVDVAVAGQRTIAGGNRISRSQKVKALAGSGGTTFRNRDGKRVAASVAATKKGNIRSGYTAERKGASGRTQVLVGGGQSG